MPYKCNVCGKLYAESSPELRDVMLRGSCICGKRFLMYIRKSEQATPVRFEPMPEDKIMQPSPYLPQKTMPAQPKPQPKPEPAKPQGPLDWLNESLVRIKAKDEPMYLSIETIKILEDGKYHIDITSLMGGKPIIVKDEGGVYYIDVPYAMKKKKR
jgi:predicted  nucleic acid-binding Zn-ribbon protein